jgi:hypothetical protein
MKSTLQTLLVLILLAGWVLAATALHVVRKTDGGIGVVPKNRLGLRETYLDLRTWTPADVPAHPAFCRRLIDSGKTPWLKDILGSTSSDLTPEITALLAGAPAPATRPASPASRPTTQRSNVDHSPRFMGVK